MQVSEGPIGFVGIGNMGAPMVRCLAAAGFDVVVFDQDHARAEALTQEAKVTSAESLHALANRCPVIITMVPNSKIVARVALGTGDPTSTATPADDAEHGGDALVSGAKPGTLLIDMSSSYPPDTIALGSALQARDIALIDAPVSGGVARAVTGTLAIMCGGDASLIDRFEPVLAAMGTVHRTGALGSGHATKALNNFLSAATLVATCEAVLIAERLGLDPEMFTTVVNSSSGRSNSTQVKALPYLFPRRFDSGFALELLEKDVGMAASLAKDLGLDAKQLESTLGTLEQAMETTGARDDPAIDHTAVMAHIERRSGGRKT